MDAVDTAHPRLHLVDGSLYVFRAWHALPEAFHDADGHPVQAVRGFIQFLCDLIERERPTHMAVAFDGSLTSSFRNAIYPPYKANRELPPAELDYQFQRCREITVAMGITTLIDTSFEADDLIGSALWTARAEGYRCVIVSADKDFGQLLGADDEQWDYARNHRWGPAGVFAKLGVHPAQVADYLALCGDHVDNIPGVPGIGAKTAAALLTHFGNLDSLLERAEEVAFLHLRGAKTCAARLREHAEHARLFRRLTRIALDAPVPAQTAALQLKAAPPDALDALAEQLRLGPLTRERLHKLQTRIHKEPA